MGGFTLEQYISGEIRQHVSVILLLKRHVQMKDLSLQTCLFSLHCSSDKYNFFFFSTGPRSERWHPGWLTHSGVGCHYGEVQQKFSGAVSVTECASLSLYVVSLSVTNIRLDVPPSPSLHSRSAQYSHMTPCVHHMTETEADPVTVSMLITLITFVWN